MPFCATCGASVEGRFCAKCGAAVASGAPAGTAPPPGPTPGPQPVYMSPPPPASAAAPMADNVACALCYVLGFITGILFLVLSPYNQNRVVRFHAFQSIFLSVAAIAIRIVLMIVFSMMSGFFLGAMLSLLVSLAFFIVWILMIVFAYQGKTTVLPIIGPLAQQQAG